MQTQTKNNEPNAVQTAQNRIEAIRTALANGDQKIKASDLAAARNELEFAELQQQAAIIAKQKNAESERKAHLLELQTRLKVIADSHKVVDSKFAEFEKSLANYLTACTTFQTNLNNVRGALREADLYPESDVIVAGTPPGKVSYGISVHDRMRTLTIGEISVTNVQPNDVVKPLVEQALGEFNRKF
jgi:vacuolar-type H+-ATPase subunit E/Vma4